MRQTFDFQPWEELERLQREVARAFDFAEGQRTIARHSAGPPLNVAVGDEGAQVSMALPGVTAAGLDIAVLGETLTVRGNWAETPLREGEAKHRQERPRGAFSRTLELPFRVDSEATAAALRHGILTITLPRSAKDRPQKILIGGGAAADRALNKGD